MTILFAFSRDPNFLLLFTRNSFPTRCICKLTTPSAVLWVLVLHVFYLFNRIFVCLSCTHLGLTPWFIFLYTSKTSKIWQPGSVCWTNSTYIAPIHIITQTQLHVPCQRMPVHANTEFHMSEIALPCKCTMTLLEFNMNKSPCQTP